MPKGVGAKWYNIEEDYQTHKENPEYWTTYHMGLNLIQYAIEKEGETERLKKLRKTWYEKWQCPRCIEFREWPDTPCSKTPGECGI